MQSVLFEQQDGLALVRLNRPEKMNAFNREMSVLLQEILVNCQDKKIRAVYLTGNGRAFSAGQDLSEVTDPGTTDFQKILAEQYHPVIKTIRALEKPVIAAVNGVAAGAGANIALSCDLVVAAESAHFLQAFSRIGLVPDSGGSYFLPRLVGWQKAAGLIMLGEKLAATEAERIGMVYKVYPDEAFGGESLALARQLSEMPTRALALAKKALANSANRDLDSQLELEAALQQEAAGTHDYREGVNAFLEKRPPRFKGE